MADNDLTDKQISFLEKYCSIDVHFQKKKAAEKRAAKEQEFRLFNAAAAGTRKAAANLVNAETGRQLTEQIKLAQTILEGKGGKTDLNGALNKLNEINGLIDLSQLQSDCDDRRALLRIPVEEALAKRPENRLLLQATWEMANERAAKGGKADLVAAMTMYTKLEGLIAGAKPGSPQAVGSVADSKTALTEDARRKAELARMKPLQTRLDQIETRCTAAFANVWPPALTLARDTAHGALTVADTDDSTAIAKKVTDAEAPVTDFGAKADQFLLDHAAYEKARQAAQSALTDMKAHKQAGDVTYIAPEITKLDSAMATGVQKANAFDFPAALTAVKEVPAKCAALFKVADDVAELAAVSAVRETLVGTLSAAPKALDEVRLAVEAAEKLLTDAKSATTAGKLAEAVAKYDAIPAAVEKARILVRHAEEFDDQYQWLEDGLTDFEKETGEVKAGIAPNLAIFKTQLQAANTLSTTNIAGAITKMTGLGSLRGALVSKIDEIKTYLTDKEEFEDRLKEIKDRDGVEGRVAIEDFYQRLLADKTRAEALVAPGAKIREWAMASRIVTASAGLQAEKLALADVAKDYLALHKDLDTQIKDLKSKDNGIAAQPLAGAEALLANAVAQKDAKDWEGAVETLNLCKAQVAKIKSVKVAADKVANAKTDPAFATIATNFNAAYAAYGKAAQAAAGEDGAGTFTSLRSAAANKATQARAAATGTPPNPTQAEALLKQAIDDCGRVIKLAGERAAFLAIETPVAKDITDLPAENVDDVITDELDAADNLMQTADTQNQAPGFGYGASIGLAMQAQALMTKAKRKVAAFNDMIADRDAVEDSIAELDDVALQPTLAAELKRMKDLKTEITDLLKAGEAAKAKIKAAEGAKLAPAYTAVAEDLIEAERVYQQWLLDKIDEVELEGTPAEITAYAKPEMDELLELKTKGRDIMTAKAFKAVQSIATQAYHTGEAAKALVIAGKAYEPVRVQSAAELKKLTDQRPIDNAFIEDQIAALEARYAAALEQAKLRNFGGAKKRLDPLAADCLALGPTLVEYQAYRTARTDAGKALADLSKINDHEAIEPAVARLRGQHAAGVTLGDKGDFQGAKTEFDLLIAGCATARKTAEDHLAFGKVIEDAKSAPSGDEAALKKQIAAARQRVKDQQKDPEALFVLAEIMGAKADLDEAETLTTDATACVAKIKDAMDACALARLGMGLYAQLSQSEAKAQKDISDLLALPMAAFVRDGLTGLQGRLDSAMTAVRSDPGPAKRAEVQAEIEAVLKDFLRLKLAAEAQVKHVALRDAITVELARMDRHDQRFAMKDDIALARQMIATADDLAEKHNHPAALKRLQQAQELQESALLKAEMAGDKAPDPAAIKKILAREDGSRQLDALVATLSDVAKKKVLRVAFEARYGCRLVINKPVVDQAAINTFTTNNPTATQEEIDAITEENTTYPDQADGDGKGPNIQRFYTAMTALPDSDTLDNDSMLEFEATEGKATGSYYGGPKRVTMREGEFGDSGIYGVGLEHELSEIEPDCKPVPSEPITYFNWNTLHEVGHAVDDKKGFMKTRGKALAGWEEYGGNTLPIARLVAAQYKYDAGYVADYMSGTKEPPIPEPAGGATPEDWENSRVQCRMWVDRARNDVSPWSSDASAKAVAIGGTVYQESYSGVWTSYPLSERKKGVSGYQFRAPGEWFSELYAAFHTGKLNPKHPAASWLKDL